MSSRTEPLSAVEARALRIQAARRAAILGMAVNGVLALVKGTAGVLGNAYVLVADAIESLTDVMS